MKLRNFTEVFSQSSFPAADDIPRVDPRIAAETIRRFWTMLAHHQGGLLNVVQLAGNLRLGKLGSEGEIGVRVKLP